MRLISPNSARNDLSLCVCLWLTAAQQLAKPTPLRFTPVTKGPTLRRSCIYAFILKLQATFFYISKFRQDTFVFFHLLTTFFLYNIYYILYNTCPGRHKVPPTNMRAEGCMRILLMQFADI